MQENLDREKKVRADVEKVKRKLETDLKATQEAVEELDRIKKDLEDNVRRSAWNSSVFIAEGYVRLLSQFHPLVSLPVTKRHRILPIFLYRLVVQDLGLL